MLAIPDLELILIQPPRTGSTALRAAIETAYPDTRRLFRHMERDGIPSEYRDWRVACTIRHPFSRLHSIWRYMRAQNPENHSDKAWVARVTADANRDFDDWLLTSEDTFTTIPASDIPNPHFYAVRHLLPIARKSQNWWARPDLGPVEVLPLEDADKMLDTLGVLPDPELRNAAPGPAFQCPDPAVQTHLETYFAWDLSKYGEMHVQQEPVQDHREECRAIAL